MPSLTRCGYSDNQKYEKDALFFSRIIFIFLESTQFYSRIIEGGGGFRSGKSQAKFLRWVFGMGFSLRFPRKILQLKIIKFPDR